MNGRPPIEPTGTLKERIHPAGRLWLLERARSMEDSPVSDFEKRIDENGLLGAYVSPQKDFSYLGDVTKRLRFIMKDYCRDHALTPNLLIYSARAFREAGVKYDETLDKFARKLGMQLVDAKDLPLNHHRSFSQRARGMDLPLGFANEGWFWKAPYSNIKACDLSADEIAWDIGLRIAG